MAPWSKVRYLFRTKSAAALGWIAFLISYLETGQTVLSHECGDAAPEQLGPCIAVFCHFDKYGRVRDHSRYYIDSLRAEGFDIVFVTNSGRLGPSDHDWVRGRASRLVFRRNLGYDFGAWRDAMAVCGLPTADTRFLLIANDSVYGPLHPLAPVLERIDFDQADVWSATDSWQHRFHLQSFFVAFGPKAFRHDAFRSFWRSIRNVRSKWWVVRRYELSMSQVLTAAGLRCKALWPYMDMIDLMRKEVGREDTSDNKKAREDFDVAEATRKNAVRILHAALLRIPVNPTADMWQVLIGQGCPFLKRELLNRNPSKVMDVAAWYDVVGQKSIAGRDLILRDLEHALRWRTP